MRIAIDAMGGDHAPQAIVQGTVESARQLPDIQHTLVGDRTRIEPHLATDPAPPSNLTVVHASQIVEMGEHPVEALRRKRDNSISVCGRLVREGKVDGFISAGNTGAAVAAGFYYLGQLEGVKRAGIAVPMPMAGGGRCIIIDVGANLNCRPIHLIQYAVMASIYAKEVFKVAGRPRVGLLNVGTEAGKGNRMLEECRARLERLSLNLEFVGNVEGLNIFNGTCDVVVCDGFVGNAVLKASEACSELLLNRIRQSVNGAGADVRTFVEATCRKVEEHTDYAEIGGAPLLGVRGACVIAHGRSSPRAIVNAVRYAREFVSNRVNDKIVEQIRKVGIWGGLLSGWFSDGAESE